MKRRYILLTLFLSLGLLLSLPRETSAAEFVTESYTLSQEETLEDDLYVGGETVTISGIVDGDVFASGQTVKIDGTVTGNIFVAAQTLEIDGDIHGSTYAMSQFATLSGIFSNNVFNMSQILSLKGDIGEDLFSMSATADIQGSIDDDLRVMAGQADISGKILGDAIVSAGTTRIDENNISGEYYDDAKLNEIFGIEENIEIEIPEENLEKGFTFFRSSMTLVGFLGMYIVGSLFIALMPAKSYQIKEKVSASTSDFFKSFLIGLAIFTLIPLPLIFLMITLVGFPLSIIIVGILVFVSIFGRLWVEMAFGEEILELFGYEKKNYYLSLLTGRTLSLIISFVPVLRFFYNTTLNFVAMGAIVRMKIEKVKAAKEEPKKKRVAKKTTTKKK